MKKLKKKVDVNTNLRQKEKIKQEEVRRLTKNLKQKKVGENTNLRQRNED